MSSPPRHSIALQCAMPLFLLTYLLLSFLNRPSADDYHTVALLQGQGIMDSVVSEYFRWTSRYAALLVCLVTLTMENATGTGLFLFGMLSLALVLTGVHRTMGMVQSNWSYSSSFLLVMVFFFSTYDIGESWFWLSASSTYLWSGAALLHLIPSLTHRRRPVFRWAAALLSAIYIGGSLGPLALLVILGCVLLLVMGTMKRWPSLERLDTSLLVAVLLACSSAFALLYLAPGNRIRESFFEEVSLAYSFVLNVPYAGAIGLLRLPRILLPAFVLALPLAMSIRPFPGVEKEVRQKRLILSTVIYLGIIYLYQLPITYKTQGLAADRALVFVTLITIAYVLFTWLLILPSIARRTRHKMSRVSQAAMVTLCALSLLWVVMGEWRYTTAHDARTAVLEEARGGVSPTLELLPRTVFYHSAEISTDSTHHTNAKLKVAFDLKRVPVVYYPTCQ